jgi:hypothetical protein
LSLRKKSKLPVTAECAQTIFIETHQVTAQYGTHYTFAACIDK